MRVVSIVVLAIAIVGSHEHRCLAARPVQQETSSAPVRDVHVRVAKSVRRFRIRADESVRLVETDDKKQASIPAADWIEARVLANQRIGFGGDSWSADSLLIETQSGHTIWLSIHSSEGWSEPVEYPGSLILRSGDGATVDVINRVDVEHYVAGVVAREIWPTFQEEAYRAQAIVARTFVLYHMARSPQRDVDVSATDGFQVYRGVRNDATGRRAAEATRYTRGVVCTYEVEGRAKLFCAYYSTACGGLSQSAAIFGPENNVPPLSGNVSCDYCEIAPRGVYRWGPVKLRIDEALDRLTARYPDFALLGRITHVTPIERTSGGRPVRLKIIGSSGRQEEILAERFRLAMGASLVKSTDYKIEITKSHLVFKDGRGHGHGLGLCQWGMEGLARRGRKAGQILRHYFPGCQLTRVY